jgi:hypothetical protein
LSELAVGDRVWVKPLAQEAEQAKEGGIMGVESDL